MLSSIIVRPLNRPDFSFIPRTFNQYTLSRSPEGLSLAMYYPSSHTLKGEIHMDAQLLTAIERLAQFLKIKGIVNNKLTDVVDENLVYGSRTLKKEYMCAQGELNANLIKIVMKEDSIVYLLTSSNIDELYANLQTHLQTLQLTEKSKFSIKSKL